MKFFSIVLIVFFSLVVTDSYAIITITIHPGKTFTGGDWSGAMSGSYINHQMEEDEYGYTNVCMTCEDSESICSTARQSGQDIIVTIYNLVSEGGGGSGAGQFNYYRVSYDSTGLMTIENVIYPYGH